MSDDIDRANDQAEAILAAQIAQQQSKPKMQHIGFCHWCDERVEAPLLFCDSDCRDDYQHEQEVRKKQGLL